MGVEEHQCAIRGCHELRKFGYIIDGITFGICDKHWEWHNADEDSPKKLRRFASWRIQDNLDKHRIRREKEENG